MEFRYRSRLEIECKQLGEFLDAKRAGSHCDELNYAMGKCPVCPLNSSQRALMSRPTFLVTRLVRPQGLLDGGHKCVPPDNPPTGTYITEISETHQEISIDALHAVGFFCEDVDDQLLVLCFPPFVFSMGMNDRLDVILNVLLLSS